MSALVEAERLSTSNLFDIGGRNALITGGTSGIGFMIAKGLIANGIRQLFITGIEPNAIVDQKVAELHLFAKESGRNPQIFGMQTNLSQRADIYKVAWWVRNSTSQLDILLSNAGVRRDAKEPLQSYTDCTLDQLQTSLLSHAHDEWTETFTVNTTAHFFLTAELLDLLGAAADEGDGRGCVVVTSSCASMHLCTNVDLMSYAASKAATDHVVHMLAAKVGRFGIRVNGINPGFFDTAMNPINAEGNMFSNLFDKVPAKRAGLPEDIVATILYLVSKAGAYVNGHSLCVDGGRILVANGQE